MKTVFLIDANSIIHRSFHALPPLTTPDGKPVQAIYGLGSVLIKLRREEHPEYCAALFDRPEPTFRKKVYKEYKAQRPAAPTELISQIIEAHNLFTAFGIKTFEKPGFEADDLIATLAEKMKKIPDTKVIILTGDMDTLQLVDGEKVVVRAFKVGITKTITYDPAAVEERYGLRPDQIVDYKSLVGDASDNVKGVPGIGPKTAADMLKKYGTLEALYAEGLADPKVAAKILQFKKEALQSKHLVTLKRDVPVGVETLDDIKRDENIENMHAYFQKLGFKTLAARLHEEEKPPISAQKPKKRDQAMF